MRVIIVGCGIGGATAALALQKAGIEHVVLEQAAELKEVGAGLQLSPNAVRVLEWVGLSDELAKIGAVPQAHLFIDGLSGETLLQTPLMPKVRDFFGAPYYHAHRAELLDILTGATTERQLRLNAEVTSISQNADGVRVTLADGSEEHGDVLIGADGVHSVVREQVFKPDPPRNTGCAAWRGLVPPDVARDLGFERNAYAYMAPHRCAVLYYVSGGEMFNWVGIGPHSENARESWSQRGSNDAALAEYAGWLPQVRDIIAETENLFMTSMRDREPLEKWADGRIALLGDAAHAMLPYHAQGAGQSIEDAWVLARCIEMGASDIPAALLKYQNLRIERANKVQMQSRQAEHMFQMSDADEIAQRNARFAKHQDSAPDGFPIGQRWLYSYDAEKAVTGTDEEWQALSW